MVTVLTNSLAYRIEKPEIDALQSRLYGIRSIPANPFGVEVKRFGNATAFSVLNILGPSFNTVKGITDEDEREIAGILEFYQQKGMPVQLEITPAHVSFSLMTYLAGVGFYQSGFHTTLYMDQPKIKESEPYISIRKLRKDEFDILADIYADGFDMPAFLKNGISKYNEVLYENEHWTFYLASVEGQPAGIGVVFIKDKIANLAAATTLPAMRNNGVHQALINKRIEHAISMNCDFVVGQAKFGSISQNNMERSGMRIAYTKAIWIPKNG